MLFKLGMQHLCRKGQLRDILGKQVTFNKAFEPRHTQVAVDICGLWLPCITRRPIFHYGQDLVNFIAVTLARARNQFDISGISDDPKLQSKQFWTNYKIPMCMFSHALYGSLNNMRFCKML